METQHPKMEKSTPIRILQGFKPHNLMIEKGYTISGYQIHTHTRVLVNVTKQMKKALILRCMFLHQYLGLKNKLAHYIQHPLQNAV